MTDLAITVRCLEEDFLERLEPEVAEHVVEVSLAPCPPHQDQPPRLDDAHPDALHRWAGLERGDIAEQAIIRRVHDILARAEPGARRDEVLRLLDSYLNWLEFHVRHEL